MVLRGVRAIALRVLLLGVLVAGAGLITLLVASGTDPTVVDCGGRPPAPGTGCGIDGWVGDEDAVREQEEGIAETKRLGAVTAVIGGVLAFGALLMLAAVVDIADRTSGRTTDHGSSSRSGSGSGGAA